MRINDPDTCGDCGRDLRVRSHAHDCPRREVTCEGCGGYVPQRVTTVIDLSPPDEYYPEIRHLCPNCDGSDDADRGEGVATDGGRPEHRAVERGFECECGATRRAPLGIARHRSNCRRTGGESA